MILRWLALMSVMAGVGGVQHAWAEDARAFTRLTPIAVTLAASAQEFPGGRYKAANLLDGQAKTEFASSGQGVQTFVEFDLGRNTPLAAFKHVDRNDPAIIAASELILLDEGGKVVGRTAVRHVRQKAGITFHALERPIVARRVRWQVTELGSVHRAVGGAEVAFFAAGEMDSHPRGVAIHAQTLSIVERRAGGAVQPLWVLIEYPYLEPLDCTLHVEGMAPRPIKLTFGGQRIDFVTPVVEVARSLAISIQQEGKNIAQRQVELKPVRRTTVYILPHSHTDIGYTEIQSQIEDKQVNNLLLGIRYARRTADYPPGARFVWNVEVLWAADLYLRRLDQAQRDMFFDAVKKGQVALCGMYLNELTGLCREEELLRLFQFATRLREQTGVAIDSAMISDVPGYTWGTVAALAQAGIKYFSVAPNYSDRIGDILVKWENKPFYWIGPSGKEKVLVWIPWKGYALSHLIRELTPDFVQQYLLELDRCNYPYDIAYVRWAGHGDNAAPDPSICEFVKEWSSKYEWPRLVIGSTSQAFKALEERCADRIPQVRGDWTPYWEDGAGSSALETGMNRASADRLAQAEALWAMRRPSNYPAADFESAWRNVLLYSEHTWGAWCSVREPARKETTQQWAIKSSYATAADQQSRDLLCRAAALGDPQEEAAGIDVINTTGWSRTDLAIVPKYLSERRNRVLDDQGKPAPSQRLKSGELVFLANAVPGLTSRRYTLEDGTAHADSKVSATGTILENDRLRIELDARSGGIVHLVRKGLNHDHVDASSGQAINDYLYLVGDNLAELQRSGPARITVKEAGPLVASLLVESDAPGCHKLYREVRLVAGQDHLELVNCVDKQRILAADYQSSRAKESVNFAFPFHVPGGQVRVDAPFSVFRPDMDQIPSACKNWLTAGRWADVSNEQLGVTWVTLDAPLVQAGGITATLLNSQSNPDAWLKQIGATQKLYSWAMNNHWHTNYRAYQEGPVTFRYVLRPHGPLNLAEAARLAIGQSQPLLAAAARGKRPPSAALVRVGSDNVLLTSIKPSDDGKAIILRLWECCGRDGEASLAWADHAPGALWHSDLSEKPQGQIRGALKIPAWGLVTLRAEWP